MWWHPTCDSTGLESRVVDVHDGFPHLVLTIPTRIDIPFEIRKVPANTKAHSKV